jgi:hypothetical protein
MKHNGDDLLKSVASEHFQDSHTNVEVGIMETQEKATPNVSPAAQPMHPEKSSGLAGVLDQDDFSHCRRTAGGPAGSEHIEPQEDSEDVCQTARPSDHGGSSLKERRHTENAEATLELEKCLDLWNNNSFGAT